MSKSVVLLSGGLDSAVAANMTEGGLYALSVDYRQRHRIELEAAKNVAQWIGVEDHQVVTVAVPWAKSGILDGDLDRDRVEMPNPTAYLPARNVVLLAYALAYAESVGAEQIVVGFNADDHEGYPDCRPSFRAAWEAMASEAVAHRIELVAPLQYMTKRQIVDAGDPELMALTWSCYDPQDAAPCGTCDACVLRDRAFGV